MNPLLFCWLVAIFSSLNQENKTEKEYIYIEKEPIVPERPLKPWELLLTLVIHTTMVLFVAILISKVFNLLLY